MLDELLKDRTTRLIQSAFSERRQQLPRTLVEIQSEFSRHGTLHSSMYVFSILRALEEELGIRVSLAWTALVRAHRNAGAAYDVNLSVDFKEYIREITNSVHEEMVATLTEKTRNISTMEPKLDEAVDRALEKHDIEIDLYVDTLQTTNVPNGQPTTAPVYNFYGAVGAVQTGEGSTATVIQQLSQSEKESVIALLEETNTALQAAPECSTLTKEQTEQLIRELVSELQKDSPNDLRFSSLIGTVSNVLQTIVSARPAYTALKGALLPFGIVIP